LNYYKFLKFESDLEIIQTNSNGKKQKPLFNWANPIVALGLVGRWRVVKRGGTGDLARATGNPIGGFDGEEAPRSGQAAVVQLGRGGSSSMVQMEGCR
jgi:hypothetical protein